MANESDPRSGHFVIVTPVSPYVQAVEGARDRLDVRISDILLSCRSLFYVTVPVHIEFKEELPTYNEFPAKL